MELPTLIIMIIFEFKILRKCLPLYILPWEKEQTEILLAPFSNMPTSTQSRKRQSRAVMLEWEPSIRVGRMKGPAVGWKPKVAWCQPCYMPSTRALQRAGGMVCREESTSGAHPAQIFQSSNQSFMRECIGTAFSLCSAKCMWQSTDLICMVLVLWILEGLDVRLHCCCLYRFDPFLPICCPCMFEAVDVIKLPALYTSFHKNFMGLPVMENCHLSAKESAVIHNQHIGTKFIICTHRSRYQMNVIRNQWRKMFPFFGEGERHPLTHKYDFPMVSISTVFFCNHIF